MHFIDQQVVWVVLPAGSAPVKSVAPGSEKEVLLRQQLAAIRLSAPIDPVDHRDATLSASHCHRRR
ncbi:hypothetical protein HGA13_08805 [Nocardia speluncae]|uniref:Uncharacterized protein n=1 Tax=Nocardia speluncae TaxID=419477 RepID=A0A846XCP2_9NOCA|nr:hypothetical protein [Nocardia speluncae]NKY33165.1 hypothetical protein [Nocardia speluncae]